MVLFPIKNLTDSTNEFWCLTAIYAALQDPLPGPKCKLEVDGRRGDLELFQSSYCIPGLGLAGLGDRWPDATWMIVVLFSCISRSVVNLNLIQQSSTHM